MILTDRRAILDVLAERARQDEKRGEQDYEPLYWLGILTEELGEVAKCCIEDTVRAAKYRAELVQVAAVAVAAIEALDRAMTAPAAPRSSAPPLTDADLARAETLVGHHAGWCAVHRPVADVVGVSVPDAFCTCGAWEFGVMYVDMLHDLKAARAALADAIAWHEASYGWAEQVGAAMDPPLHADFAAEAARRARWRAVLGDAAGGEMG